jgi:hypothetical protein
VPEPCTSTPCNGEALANRRGTAVVVRLVLDDRGTLCHGEIVDRTGRVRARFVAWDALMPAIRAWLEREEQQGAPGELPRAR